MDVKIEPSWKNVLRQEFDKPYFLTLAQFVRAEYSDKIIYPPAKDIFRAFALTPFEKVKVVILGQDPYHEENQANGLCFAVKSGMRLPPSVQNIFKELKTDLGRPTNFPDGDLTGWAKQGVLLLNATLTVAQGSAGSHQKKGWEEFTDAVIRKLTEKRSNLVYILWGNYAQKKGEIIDSNQNYVIKSPHPSPFSAYSGFFGSKPFSKCNKYLKDSKITEIEW